MLVLQIVTGIVLAMHYTPHVDAWPSTRVEHIMRDVNYGWLLRYMHMPTARRCSSSSSTSTSSAASITAPTRRRARCCGSSACVIFLLMMATAFMGYVLPWGQMSFWGATVITNLFSAHPAGRRSDRDLAVGRLRGRQPDAEPLLLAALPAAVRDRRPWWSCTSGRCTCPASNNPLGIDVEGAAGHDALPSLLHGQGRLRRSACS